MDDMAFEAAMALYNKEFDEAEPFDNWYPPDYDYTCMVSKVKRGVTEKDNAPFLWWKIMAKIIFPGNEELDGQEFQLAFFSNKSYGQMKTVCNTISQNTAKRSQGEYNSEMDGYIGTCLNVKVHREVSSKSGKPFVATDITEVIPQTEVTSAE